MLWTGHARRYFLFLGWFYQLHNTHWSKAKNLITYKRAAKQSCPVLRQKLATSSALGLFLLCCHSLSMSVHIFPLPRANEFSRNSFCVLLHISFPAVFKFRGIFSWCRENSFVRTSANLFPVNATGSKAVFLNFYLFLLLW